jgi:hypothetical protein
VPVAHADLRIALGSGLIAAALTVGGPCIIAASADPGNSGWGHSHNGSDSNRGHGNDRPGRDGRSPGDDGHDGRGDDHRDGDHRDGDHRGGDHRDGDHRDGDHRDGSDRNRPSTSRNPETIVGNQVSAPSNSRPTVSAGTSPVTTAPAAQAPPAAPPVDGAGGGSSARVEDDAAPDAAPSVTVGDGRSPGLSGERPDEPNVAVSSVPTRVSSAPAPPAPPALMALPRPAPAGPKFIERIWSPLRPTFGGGPLFGITGLVIMPLAGMWLGYRQARAAKTAARPSTTWPSSASPR